MIFHEFFLSTAIQHQRSLNNAIATEIINICNFNIENALFKGFIKNLDIFPS